MMHSVERWVRRIAGTLAMASAAGCGGVAQEDLGEQNDQVIGGSNAAVNAFPYQAQISRAGVGHWCGGSLISNRWIVTAAHCVSGVAAADLTVTMGNRSLSGNDGTEQVRSVSQIIIHPKYGTPNSVQNDIALIQLSSAVTLNTSVNTIALPDGRYTATTSLTISGWGQTASGSATPDILQQAALPPVDQGTCATAMNNIVPGAFVASSMICAGRIAPTPKLGGCHGDSGGPLATTGSARQLVGVVSWGEGTLCGKYTVFTRVADFVPWIRQKALGTAPISCQGQTLPTNTDWKQTSDFVSLSVDTSQCGYTATPEYFTSLGGTTNTDAALGVNAITDATATGFNVYLTKPGGITVAQAKSWQWHVNWTAAPKSQVNASLCTGSTPVSTTAWVQSGTDRLYVDVNTSACGRTAVPKYFATVKAMSGTLGHSYLRGINNFYSPTATGFRIYAEFSATPSPIPITPAFANSYQWHIDWAAAPSAPQAAAAQCVGNTSNPLFDWTQSGTDVITTTVNTSACGRTQTPLYFTSLRGVIDHSNANGITSVKNVGPSSFQVFIRQPGITPLVAGLRLYTLDWAAYP